MECSGVLSETRTSACDLPNRTPSITNLDPRPMELPVSEEGVLLAELRIPFWLMAGG